MPSRNTRKDGLDDEQEGSAGRARCGGGLGGFLLYTYLQRFEQEASGGTPVRLLVLVKPVEPGTVLADNMLATRLVPQAYVENRAVRESERAKVIGLRAATNIQATQPDPASGPISPPSPPRRRTPLARHERPARRMRAVGVRAGFDERSVALIHPGDRVDIIATTPEDRRIDARRTSVVLLQNLLVLAVGLDIGADVIEADARARRPAICSSRSA